MPLDQELSALSAELEVPVPVGVSDAEKLFRMLQKLKDLIDALVARVEALENP